jgi:hypothetical protein
MSGGGRDDSYLGPSPPGGPPDCEGLKFTTGLSSPQPDVVQQLSQDDILRVALEDVEGRPRVAVRTVEGAVAGAITSGRLGELLDCLQQGHKYQVRVVSIEGGHVRVEVRYVR